MKHNDLDDVGRKSHYELEDELETLQKRMGTLQATPIPEITLTYAATATLPVDARFFYLPRDHFYEAGRGHITRISVDGVDKTAGQGPVWDECVRSGTGAFPGKDLLKIATYYDDGSIGNLTWGIERLVTTASEEWTVQWIEKRITFNPLEVRGCYMSGDTTFVTTGKWIDRDAYYAGSKKETTNTNGVIVSGCPIRYQIMLMVCQRNRWNGSGRTGARGKHWRPALRCWPRSGTDWEAFRLADRVYNRLVGVALYNPETGARSEVKLIGYTGKLSGAGEREIRVLK